MSHSGSEYDAYSDDSFDSEESEVKGKQRKYSTKGISLDNPIDYRREKYQEKTRRKDR